MDIPSLSMSMAQTNLLTDVGTAMLAKSMEQADLITASMTEMLDASAMELSVNPDIGANIDISV
ncbi:MAG: YjfB family protein [Lachnospiraceae bacterium]|nr:YjfB family protein [Lachnospiraceae bacterium]MDE6621753.1 YjfB family protein [Lachnospiraceae bacterium]MDE7273970.1 YjfB family protein [Lachnospiraceae bacterium]